MAKLKYKPKGSTSIGGGGGTSSANESGAKSDSYIAEKQKQTKQKQQRNVNSIRRVSANNKSNNNSKIPTPVANQSDHSYVSENDRLKSENRLQW